VLVYSTLFCIGEICFGRYPAAVALGMVAVACGIAIWQLVQGTAAWQEM